MTCKKISGGIVCVTKTYKPGDQPPDGYLEWYEWAEMQRKAGIKQVQCISCGIWKTPQELSDKKINWIVTNSLGIKIKQSGSVCNACENKNNPT